MPDAIIFIPGLGRSSDQSVDIIAKRLAAGFDREAESSDATFVTREGAIEDFRNAQTRVVRIERKENGTEIPVADVYALDYSDRLIGAYRRRPPLLQAFTIFSILLTHFPKLIRFFSRPSKSSAHKIHVLYGGFLFFLLTLYLALLVGTAALTALQWAREVDGQNAVGAASTGTNEIAITERNVLAQPAKDEVNAQYQRITRFARSAVNNLPGLAFFQSIIVLFTALGMFTRVDIKVALTKVSTEMACAINYLNSNDRSGMILGLLSDLLEHIHEKKAQVNYERIHIIGYSFGSVVAIDSLFCTQTPSVRFRRIDALITIGCPYDFIRTYWPEYFQNRKGLSDVPRRWFNVLKSADVLGSDFHDEEKINGKIEKKKAGLEVDGEPRCPENIYHGPEKTLKECSVGEKFAFIGFKLHERYWEADEAGDKNCFDLVVRAVYRGHPTLN